MVSSVSSVLAKVAQFDPEDDPDLVVRIVVPGEEVFADKAIQYKAAMKTRFTEQLFIDLGSVVDSYT